MLNFKKYSSIENSYDSGFMERVREQMPSDLNYVVQEKVHGTNTSFICDGIVIRPVVPMYLRNGSRVMIKSKNERKPMSPNRDLSM